MKTRFVVSTTLYLFLHIFNLENISERRKHLESYC